MEDIKEIIEAIKEARKAKGLSQARLGERIGVPQSHISKIERGGVDIKLSSLIQIARVLDLEVGLVPKKAIPALKSFITSIARDQTSTALSEIRNAQKAIDQLQLAGPVSNTLLETFERMNKTLQDLRTLNYDGEAFGLLHKALSPFSEIMTSIKQADLIKHLNDDRSHVNKQLRKLDHLGNNLRNLCNTLALRHGQKSLFSRPAYSLEDNND